MKKYILIGGIAIIFLTLLLLSFNRSVIEYTDFQNAEKLNRKVQVVGTLVKEMPVNYDPNTNYLEFYMKDKKGTIKIVRFNGPQPNNFTIAPEFVVKGNIEDTIFLASQIITKCPSKYEGELENLKK
ncbi:MAG: cytochrome c maturation protein CcmE [Candidatus Kapaibacteriota bacterium]